MDHAYSVAACSGHHRSQGYCYVGSIAKQTEVPPPHCPYFSGLGVSTDLDRLPIRQRATQAKARSILWWGTVGSG
jgi:hypothetical protein